MELLEFGISAEEFSVDEERRTMTGPVVRWGSISTPKNGRRYRFSRGSIRCVDPKFIKFREDHDQAQRLGRAIRMEENDTELRMTFKVAEGPRGDRALAKASSGQKTGLSVGVEFDAADTEKDPDNAGVWIVSLANCEEVSFVERPSFDDSHITSVVMSADEGEGMDPEEQTPAAQPGQDTTQVLQMSRDDLRTLIAEMLPKPEQQGTRQPVVPRPGNAQVTEPQNYRFSADGLLEAAKYDFGIDLVRGYGGGADFTSDERLAARRRVEEFVEAQFTVTTDVDELNPTINLPKYVDQRDFRTPVWNAIFLGAPPNGVQPFAWPGYSSSSGLVGAHTEGTEPTAGTYVTTKQTVTPAPKSGKAKLSREIWDMGGTPGLSGLLWRQMQRGYQESLEALAIATLDAATPTGITLTALAVDSALDQSLTSQLAMLQFVRGGFTFDTMFTQADLYKALVAAKDTAGRRLYPALGPNNALGTVRTKFAALDVNGVTAYPSWALAAAGQTTPVSSYLIDPLSVNGWATAPRQLTMPEIEVANVYIGIWGYAAAAIADINGVREVIYDPA